LTITTQHKKSDSQQIDTMDTVNSLPKEVKSCLNILLVAPWQPEAGRAGVQSSAGTLVRSLCKQHKVTILTPLAGSKGSPTRISDQVTVYCEYLCEPIKSGRFNFKAALNWLISLPRSVRYIMRICREERIDVIHLYQLQMSHFPISLVRRLGGPPMVGTFHGRDVKEYPIRPIMGRWLVRQVTSQTTAFTSVSSDLARIAKNTVRSVQDVSVIRNGMGPVDSEEVSRESAFTRKLPKRFFLSVGRLYPLGGPPVKGHDLAIRAWATLKNDHPDLHLVIMGNPVEETAYRALAQDQNCSHLIHILGSHPRNDVLRAMFCSMGVITASRHEGGGPTMTVLEAGALAKPLIASNIPAYTETLTNDKDSIIVPKEDVAAIVSAVERLLDDPLFAKNIGQSLRELVETNYSSEQTAKRYSDVYLATVAKAKNPLDQKQ